MLRAARSRWTSLACARACMALQICNVMLSIWMADSNSVGESIYDFKLYCWHSISRYWGSTSLHRPSTAARFVCWIRWNMSIWRLNSESKSSSFVDKQRSRTRIVPFDEDGDRPDTCPSKTSPNLPLPISCPLVMFEKGIFIVSRTPKCDSVCSCLGTKQQITRYFEEKTNVLDPQLTKSYFGSICRHPVGSILCFSLTLSASTPNEQAQWKEHITSCHSQRNKHCL